MGGRSGRYSLARAAQEEAKRIDPEKREETDKLIAWIDRRESGGSHWFSALVRRSGALVPARWRVGGWSSCWNSL